MAAHTASLLVLRPGPPLVKGVSEGLFLLGSEWPKSLWKLAGGFEDDPKHKHIAICLSLETCRGGTSDVSRELEFSPKHLPLSPSAESPSISPRRASEGPMRDVRDGGGYKEFPRTREGGQLVTGKMGNTYGTGLSCYDNLNHCILRRTMRVFQG